ncbi:MAG: hypothetical protein L6Q71_12715, partial [Planctomycetes bacterium]|nr:hypothetical protein [Planctomycetota bacterium]
GRVRGSATIESALDKSQSVTVLDDGDFNTHAAELMAFMPQSGKLGFIDELGVFTNATFFCELDRERAQLAVEKLGGKLRMWPLPSSLATASGGEAMRVSALRALMPRGPDAKPPCVLIADEAGSGLDAEANERLSAALRETALSGETVAIVIAHDAAPLVGKEAAAIRPAEGNDITIYEYTFGEHGLVYAGDAGRLVRTAVADPPGLLERAGKKLAHAFEIGGGVALSPVAFITGCAGIRGRLVPIVLGDILRTVFNPTTWVFVAAAALMVSITVGVFIFQLFPC